MEELEELSHINWNGLGLHETPLPEEKCTILKSGHMLYKNLSNTNCYNAGVALLNNKKVKN